MTINQARILAALKKRDGQGYGYALAKDLDIPIDAVRSALETLNRHGYLNSHLVASPRGPARRVWELSPRGRHAINAYSPLAAT